LHKSPVIANYWHKGTLMTENPGAHTLEEILSQPGCWGECLKTLDEKGQLQETRKRFPPRSEWLFVGCGTSYYIAQAAAASWTFLTGLPARAAPASEVLLFPHLIFPDSTGCQPVLISRSGHTSEILKAAEYLELKRNTRTLAVSCATHQPLEEISTATLYVLPADEKSTVMSRSFSSMLLSLQALAATYGNQGDFADSLRRLPECSQAALDQLHPRIREFVQGNDFSAYVFLGQGPFVGVANESMLKVKEMSCSFAQSFHTLEFRHGPKAIVTPETLIGFLLSETGFEAEREVLQEVKGLGGTTFVVANHADAATREAADFLVELNLEVPEYARLAPYVMAGQLMGLYTGLKKGLDSDRPRNLSRVVILNDNN
jgi:glucosamine--fructose-6-phosphate aminotransferase (isomerizing)